MAAGRYNITIEQGATYDLNVQYVDSNSTPINLSGYSARMDIRPSAISDTIYLRLSSSLQEDGTGITFNGEGGTLPLDSGSIYVYVSAANTTILDFDLAVYDLELTSGSVVTRILQGNVKLSKEVTSNRGTPPNVPTGSGVTYATTGSNTFIGNQIITGSVIATAGFTGSFSGSFDGTFTSASFASTASYWSGSILNAVSASYALTASFWSGSIVNALSASFASTASFWSGSVANALSSSYALTASFAQNVVAINTGSFAVTGSNVFKGTQTISGSLAVSGSGSLNGSNIVASNTITKIETITSASYASITPVSGTLYILIN